MVFLSSDNLSLSSPCSVVSNVEECGWIRHKTNSEKQKEKQTKKTKQQIHLCAAVVTQSIYDMSIDTILYRAYSILYPCVYVYICYIDDISEDAFLRVLRYARIYSPPIVRGANGKWTANLKNTWTLGERLSLAFTSFL